MWGLGGYLSLKLCILYVSNLCVLIFETNKGDNGLLNTLTIN